MCVYQTRPLRDIKRCTSACGCFEHALLTSLIPTYLPTISTTTFKPTSNMYSTKILLSIAALAGTSLSQKSDSQFCSAFFTSLVSIIVEEAPTTPPAILSFLAPSTETASPTTTAPPLTTLDFASHAQELCEIATELPSSLLPEFQTYAEALLSFGRARSSEHIAYVTDCAPEDEVASRTSYLNYIFTATDNFCTQTPAPGGMSNGTYPTPTPDGDELLCRSQQLYQLDCHSRCCQAHRRLFRCGRHWWYSRCCGHTLDNHGQFWSRT